MNEFFFGVYPYICLVILVTGLIFRYLATPGEWNARSSNLFAKKALVTGSFIFHYAIIITFFGHVGGLLTPQCVMNAIGFTIPVHMVVATVFGVVLAPAVIIGLVILLWRRITVKDVWDSTYFMDIVVVCMIIWQACTGGWQDYVSHYNVFDTVGPWIRSLLLCQPDPQLMANIPLAMKMHVIFGFLLFAMIPFSRLVHFFSLPWTYCIRPFIVYRRRYENL